MLEERGADTTLNEIEAVSAAAADGATNKHFFDPNKITDAYLPDEALIAPNESEPEVAQAFLVLRAIAGKLDPNRLDKDLDAFFLRTMGLPSQISCERYMTAKERKTTRRFL